MQRKEMETWLRTSQMSQLNRRMVLGVETWLIIVRLLTQNVRQLTEKGNGDVAANKPGVARDQDAASGHQPRAEPPPQDPPLQVL